MLSETTTTSVSSAAYATVKFSMSRPAARHPPPRKSAAHGSCAVTEGGPAPSSRAGGSNYLQVARAGPADA
jgi:hypothetical protein